MREGDLVELQVLRDDLDGAGHARVDGTDLRVFGAFAGELVRARVLELDRRRARGRARTLEVLEPHPGRIEPACEHHPARGGRCDGCAFMPLSLAAQREAKRALLAELGLEVAEVEGDDAQWGYRHSAKRVAFGGPGRLWLGSYRRGSHRGARMQDCRVDHPRLREAAAELEREANELGVAAYDERQGRGDLRYVWLRTDGRDVVVTLVTASPDSECARGLPPRLRAAKGVALSVQPGRGNALRGDGARTLCGDTTLGLPGGGPAADVGPLGFMQPNPAVADRCYRELVGVGDPGPETGGRALNAGSGVTTALLRERYDHVTPNEIYPESAAALGVPPMTARECVEQHASRGEQVDLVVANPPRAGLGADTCQALRELAPARLHVMSCGPAALARDLAALQQDGLYRLESLRAFDTLPQTPHVELVARLVKT